MEKHPEFQSVDDPELQGISDALALAFFDMDFSDCELEALPYVPDEGDLWSNYKTRRKTGFDPTTRSHVEVVQFTFDSTGANMSVLENVVEIISEDESGELTTVLVDLMRKEVGLAIIHSDDTYEHWVAEGDDIERLTLLTKQLLSCVTEI